MVEQSDIPGMPPDPVKGSDTTSLRETATSKAYSAIRSQVLNGQLRPGVHLKEEDLASDIGVSRTPVRQALMRLAAEGMVQHMPNQGVTVRIWPHEEVVEIFKLRAMLERHGCELAAERIADKELALLRHLNQQMVGFAESDDSNRVACISEANMAFHKVIHRAARSEKLSEILSTLIDVPLVSRTFRTYSPYQIRRSIDHHNEIIEALAAHEPEWAGAIMHAHIMSAKKTFADSTPE